MKFLFLLCMIIGHITTYELVHCQQMFSENLGPRNLTRYENEPNVYIPCPFSGSANPIWRINGVDYEAFNLPFNLLPVSYGLLIPIVELGMDGKTFQCISQAGPSVPLMSSVGTLKVEKMPQEYAMFYHEHKVDVEVPLSNTLSLNHQKTIFEDEFKTFSWNNGSCSMYRVIAENCDGEEQHIWDQHIIQGTSLAIPSSFVVDSNNQSVYFKLESVNSDGSICESLRLGFAVKQSDVTQNQSTSYRGTCVNVESTLGSPVIVLPYKVRGNADCTCTILPPKYSLSSCSCGNNTIFAETFFAFTVTPETNTYDMCFFNLTRDMNNTIIHFYDSYKDCTNSHGEKITKAYSMYLQSTKLVIELPNLPDVTVNETNGTVTFSSDAAEGIKLSHYKVTLRDVTQLVVYHRTIPHTMNSTSFGDIFQQHTCSPYNVTVSAYSILGKSISYTTNVGTDRREDECACITQNVDVALDLIEGDSDPDNPVIGVQLNCTNNHYEDSVMLEITVKHSVGIIINSSLPVSCKKAVTTHTFPPGTLKCDHSYDLEAYWIPAGNTKQCKINVDGFDKSISCPEKGNSNSLKIIIGVVPSAGVLLISVVVITVLVVTICVIYRRDQNGRQ